MHCVAVSGIVWRIWNGPLHENVKYTLTHLVDHVRQQAFNFVVINLFLAAEADSGGKLGNWNAGTARRLFPFFSLFEPSSNEDLP